MSLSAPATRIRTSQLSRPDRLLLWAIRAWVIGLKRRLDVAPPLAVAFGRVGVPEAAEIVDALMSVVACGAVRTLAVECVCETGVSEDESRLLAAAGLYQQAQLRSAVPAARNPAPRQRRRRAAAGAARGCIVQRKSALSTWTLDIERFVFGPAPRPAEGPPGRPSSTKIR